MANKNVTLQDDSGNNLYPITIADNISGLSTQLSNLASKDLSNVSQPSVSTGGTFNGNDRVVETKISTDGTAWYRIWASGWKECGGQITGVAYNSSGRFTFPLPSGFSDNKYNIVGSVVTPNTDHYFRGVYFIADTGTQAKAVTSHNSNAAGAYTVRYYACGW